jgi:demethylmenaquinone methyltransferase / 2-methoxy-6-polyprenyl-1,4-benzoquinol methylase
VDCDSIPKLFDRISHGYDRVNRLLSFGLDVRWRRTLAHHLPHEAPLSLLDLATGTGDQIGALFHKKVAIQQATGIDLSQGMLQIARSKFSDIPNILFQEANAEKLPFPNQSFDLCTFSFGIRNVQKPLAALAEMLRVTKPGGRCLILEFAPPTGWFRLPYLLYLRFLVPLIGGWVTKQPAAYRYLNQSIEQFAPPVHFLRWMQNTGWKQPTAIPLLFGAVMLYRGDRAS